MLTCHVSKAWKRTLVGQTRIPGSSIARQVVSWVRGARGYPRADWGPRHSCNLFHLDTINP
ncbi:hypothetical protein MY4824_001749 [Beauveria thailandica]